MKRSTLVWGLVICFTSPAVGQLARFSFTGAAGNELSFPADFQPANVRVSDFTRSAAVFPDRAPNEFNGNGWSTNWYIDLERFYSFSITPRPGVKMTLTQLVLDERPATIGVHHFAVRSSLDHFDRDLSFFTAEPDRVWRPDKTTDLGGQFRDLTQAVEFRIYGFYARMRGGAWRVDNVRLFGSVSPAPPRLIMASPQLVRWHGYSPATYTVEVCSEFSAWVYAGEVFSNTGEFEFTNRTRLTRQRFYRVICKSWTPEAPY
jgi:hypothetical protein